MARKSTKLRKQLLFMSYCITVVLQFESIASHMQFQVENLNRSVNIEKQSSTAFYLQINLCQIQINLNQIQINLYQIQINLYQIQILLIYVKFKLIQVRFKSI